MHPKEIQGMETTEIKLSAALAGVVTIRDGNVIVLDEKALRGEKTDALVHAAVFGQGQRQAIARWLIWESALALGIVPASINALYAARGRGETPIDFTVPAMNLRMLGYDSARAVFSAARRLQAGAMIFEIARSEMTYTDQRPAEYATVVLAAALREGYRGPVFIQGDHFQVNAKKYAANPGAEVQGVRDLIAEAIPAGFYNIDIDTSTLVNITLPTVPEQQAVNSRLCAELTRFIREREPQGLTISVGGEIGEVGTKNSTEEELRAFMDGYCRELSDCDRTLAGLSKISIQTGTSHGGVVLPDGTMADVAVDFDVIRRLSQVARDEYGMAGAVQHGASTLPESAFGKFPEHNACEVHLATGFQNMVYDLLPGDVREEAYAWLRVNAADERKPKDTEEQFLYKSRKKAIGPFKARLWGMGEDFRAQVRSALEEKFVFLFERLNIGNTHDLVTRFVQPVAVHRTLAGFGGAERGPEDVSGLAD
jgi:fructose/tagatose bisphosphate aldolase